MRNSVNPNKTKKKKDIKKENIENLNKKINDFIESNQNKKEYEIFKNYHIYEKKIYNHIIEKKNYFLYLEYIFNKLANKKYLNKYITRLLTNISINNLREYILNFFLYYLKFYNFESKIDQSFDEYFCFLIILSENNIIT